MMKLNPFMFTSNQSYGVNVKDLKTCNFFKELEDKNKIFETSLIEQDNEEPSLAFLYTRESDRIGAEVEATHSSLAKAFEKEKSKRKWQYLPVGKDPSKSNHVRDDGGNGGCEGDRTNNVTVLRHKPKLQNPLYTTTANDIGLKQPSGATYVTKRYARSQNFSKSFNRIMFQDKGLNTSLSKSNVHERLDHFV